ncbi:MAG: hypothetical protein ACKN9T_05475, partial [Candidatus Methylumidiphilus sp.]
IPNSGYRSAGILPAFGRRSAGVLPARSSGGVIDCSRRRAFGPRRRQGCRRYDVGATMPALREAPAAPAQKNKSEKQEKGKRAKNKGN